LIGHTLRNPADTGTRRALPDEEQWRSGLLRIQELRTFVTVVDCGSIGEAAARLSYSESSVAYQLRQLERALGETLVTRRASTYTPTTAGVAILKLCRDALDCIDRIPGLITCEARRSTPVPAPRRSARPVPGLTRADP
jgi:DNA-binding transcriptional LysR family regulator